MTKDQIRAIFMAHGFTIKDGQTDLKDYVYEAAEALLSASKPAAEDQAVAERCARLAELYRDEHATGKLAEEACDAIAEACRQYAAPAQSAEPVAMKTVQEAADWMFAAPQPSQPAQAGEACDVKCAVGKYKNTDPCLECPNAAVVLDDERATDAWLITVKVPGKCTSWASVDRHEETPADLVKWIDKQFERTEQPLFFRAASPQAPAQTATFTVTPNAVPDMTDRIVEINAQPAQTRALTGDARDAARYRWLREHAIPQWRNGPGLYWYLPRLMEGSPAEKLDTVLDSALLAAQARGGDHD
ncbi:hypothetical protein [Paraburkholderia sp. HD33-4]|uniref:hypothetical protein n=1 Tax=Paraburkholderia sp. HD33-4 TaxID=2883242 RepID=UPI001F3C0B4E|nr:hypothetical protein [Paraburkholderia sp. HD33-4]